MLKPILALLPIAGMIGALGCLFFIKEMSDQSEKLIYFLLGALVTLAKDSYSYYFGSSDNGN